MPCVSSIRFESMSEVPIFDDAYFSALLVTFPGGLLPDDLGFFLPPLPHDATQELRDGGATVNRAQQVPAFGLRASDTAVLASTQSHTPVARLRSPPRSQDRTNRVGRVVHPQPVHISAEAEAVLSKYPALPLDLWTMKVPERNAVFGQLDVSTHDRRTLAIERRRIKGRTYSQTHYRNQQARRRQGESQTAGEYDELADLDLLAGYDEF
eukprot:m.285039 g.285039  ORF g.285039 m.285039 type:complete len:210 (+) comp54966_c0_seq3:368-997(+)